MKRLSRAPNIEAKVSEIISSGESTVQTTYERAKTNRGEKNFSPPAFQSYTQNYFPAPTPLIRNFWGLGNRQALFFQPHFGRHIALGEATLLRALRGRSSREADTMVNGPCPVHSPSIPRPSLDYKAVQKCYLISEEF